MAYKWTPEKGFGPWKFSASPADNRYNEGDLISDSDNPVWSSVHAGIPISPTHMPCGYWLNEYKGVYVLTSLMYAIEVDEATATGECEITEGAFRAVIQDYSYAESTDITAQKVTEGVFRVAIHDYSYTESTDITAREVTEGAFWLAIHDYSYAESTEITAQIVAEGLFRVALIEYENGDYESTNITSTAVTEGSHDTP